MEEKGKSVSLRQKRTGKLKISNPTLISGPTNGPEIVPRNTQRLPPGGGAGGGDGLPGANPRPRPRPRPGDNSQTADLVKRRYSTRYTATPDFGQAPPVPSIPSLPPQLAIQQPRGGPVRAGQPIKVDKAVLNSPEFRADDFVSASLSAASEPEIDTFQRDLRQLKTRADVDIQHNVFQNRTQFIRISKEAEKLKGEMRMLRNLMSELTGALGQTTMASSSAQSLPMPSRNRSHRSSVANLEALWSTHLQALWKRVEGSQKYLPATPGRHVLYESGRWVELNSATWKPRRKVHIILLNDHLLVATEKKRPEARDPKERLPPAQLVATKCWPLQDVQLADLSTRMAPGTGDVASSSKAINIRVGSDFFTYATASQEVAEKLSLISNFRKAAEDNRRKQTTETQDKKDVLEPGNVLASKSDMIIDVNGKPQTLRWVEAQMDDLDIDIALQRFEEAVDRLELLRRSVQGMRSNSSVQSLYGSRLDERASKLAAVILKYLSDNPAWSSAARRNVEWLGRLGFLDRGREAYLEARTQILQKRIRQVIFDGDLHLYIYQLSFIYFTVIKHTAKIFQSCFPAQMMSACVKWAKEHVDEFNALLERQLSSVDSSSTTYQECMERAHLHAAMLGEVGLDFKDLIGKPSASTSQ